MVACAAADQARSRGPTARHPLGTGDGGIVHPFPWSGMIPKDTDMGMRASNAAAGCMHDAMVGTADSPVRPPAPIISTDPSCDREGHTRSYQLTEIARAVMGGKQHGSAAWSTRWGGRSRALFSDAHALVTPPRLAGTFPPARLFERVLQTAFSYFVAAVDKAQACVVT